MIIETDDEESVIHFAFLVQADKDTQSYKVCSLSPNTDIDGQSLYDLYSLGGGATIQTKLTSYLGVDIDYYASMKTNDFIEFVNKLGTYIYPSSDVIKFSNENPDDKYSVRIGKGEQKLSGSETADILRYYSNDMVDYSKANQIILTGLQNCLTRKILKMPRQYSDCLSTVQPQTSRFVIFRIISTLLRYFAKEQRYCGLFGKD